MMIRDSPPHRVFKISELTRLIASHLILISQESAVNLACTSRHLEEPVLSTLWETQQSLHTLLQVLPEETRACPSVEPGENFKFRVTGEPSPEAWSRVQHYASWMRQVYVDEKSILTKASFRKLRANSPAGGWFPALQTLYWYTTESDLPYVNLFFYPHLKTISIFVQGWSNNSSEDTFLAIASTISALPTSALQSLDVFVPHMVPWGHFEDSLSSVAPRCGPSLVEFISSTPLSKAAADHLIQLPHLHTWRIDSSPPSYSASSFPLTFPPLNEFTLGGGVVYEWLSLFERLEDSASTARGVTPLSKMKESLKILAITEVPGFTIDISFTSPIQMFQNLVELSVETSCWDERDRGQCIFKLNNNDVTELAIALPRLEPLCIEPGCYENICATTVTSLLAISVHCVKLRWLEIHFNTTNIVDDLKTISEDHKFQELRSLPRCSLNYLDVWRTPLTLDEPDFEIVANGMIGIFPSLECCTGWGEFKDSWHGLSKKIAGIQEI